MQPQKTHDIVCHNYLNISEKTPKLEIGGKNMYFCSQECLNIYMLNPKNYLIGQEEEINVPSIGE